MVFHGAKLCMRARICPWTYKSTANSFGLYLNLKYKVGSIHLNMNAIESMVPKSNIPLDT